MKDIEKVLSSLKPVIEKLMFSENEELKEFGSLLAGIIMAKEASQEEFDLVKMPIFLFALSKFKEEEVLKEELAELGINLGGE